jgi:ketosteroid isomerase-like protein
MGAAENEELVRLGIEAWNAGDWGFLEALHAPDAEVIAPNGWPEAGTFVGWDAIHPQYRRLKEAWSWERIDVRILESVGERVLAGTRWITHGQASGIEMDQELWVVYEFADERIARLLYFLDEEPARAAARS